MNEKIIYKKINFSFLLLLVVTFTIAISKSAQSQPQEPATYRIVSINTIGNEMYDSKTIIAYSGLKMNQEITIPSDETRDAINRLWNLDLFSDIKIYIDKKFGNDIYLIIDVEELPRIDKVVISGNDDISRDDIEEQIDIVSGEVLSEQKLKDIEYNLTKFYVDEGYSLAEVKVDKLISAENEARVRIKINEGNQLTVRNIKFKGNKQVSSDDLLDEMDETTEKVWWHFWNSATFDKNKFEDDKKLIIGFYKEEGYKDAEIKNVELITSPSKEDLTIVIEVDEGKKYKINKINFNGNTIYPDSLLLSRLDFKRGDVYNLRKLEENLYGNESETDLSSLYLDNGYLGFNVDVEEKVVKGNKLDLKINISENNQFKFGMVEIEGNEKTKDKVLRRELYTVPGDYFTKTNVRRSLQQLNALNYFNPEKLGQDISLMNDSTVKITYLVEERSSDQFNASIGYGGTFGVTGSIGLTFNNFDITNPLKGGAGQTLNFNWQFGESGNFRTFSIGFQEPWLFDTPTLLGFTVYDTRQRYTYDVRETGGIINFGRRFKFPDDFFRGDWALKYQRTDVIDGDNYFQTGIRSQFSIKQTISRSTVFDPVFPTTGTKVANSTELAGGPLLPGSIEFLKNVFTAEAYMPLFKFEKIIIHYNFNFSFINSLAPDKYLPPTELFYMGGNGLTYNTIPLRGYDDRNVGPKDNFGNPIGGRVAIKYGVEIRYPLSLDPFPIFILAFADAGNIWPSITKTDPFDLRRSVGFGTRLLLPAVGLVGFDFGYGFDRLIVDNEEPKWMFHFQFGRGF
jgi:outer membrane protein insertion porin family